MAAPRPSRQPAVQRGAQLTPWQNDPARGPAGAAPGPPSRTRPLSAAHRPARPLTHPLSCPPRAATQGAVHHIFNGKPKATNVDEWDRLVAARDARVLEEWRQKQQQ